MLRSLLVSVTQEIVDVLYTVESKHTAAVANRELRCDSNQRELAQARLLVKE